MQPQIPQKRQEYPGNSIVGRTWSESMISLSIHPGNQKSIHEPANQEQSTREKPDCAGYGFAEIEPVRSSKSENPK